MREIETAKTENKALFDQRDEYLQSLRDLRFKLGSLIETTAVSNSKFKAANVLNGTSIVIARDDYFNIMFVYSLLLLLSICLDIFLAMVFCIIQTSYHKFYDKKLLLLGSAVNSSKIIVKQKMQSRRRRISNLEGKKTSKSFEESLEFIASNLEDDRRYNKVY